MHLSDHSGVKCIIGTLFVVALLKASMTPVACVYGADCKMQDVGTNTDLKCCGKNCTAQFHRVCSARAEENLCNHATCGHRLTAHGAFAAHTQHTFKPPAPKSTSQGSSAFCVLPPSRLSVSSVRLFGHSGAAAGKAPLNDWQQYLHDNMAYVQQNENLSPTEGMKVLAQRWQDQRAKSKDGDDAVSRESSVEPDRREGTPVGLKQRSVVNERAQAECQKGGTQD